MYTLQFIKQQANFLKILNGKYSKEKDLSYILGYDSIVEESVLS